MLKDADAVMKFKTLLASVLALGGMLQAGETCDTFHMFYDGSLGIPGEDAPAYKQKLYNATGTTFDLEIFGGYWGVSHLAPGYNSDNYVALVFASLNQRLIKDEVNGGTWLNVAVAGSWGLDDDSDSKAFFYDGGFGTATGHHTDLCGPAGLYLMNATLKQYFNNKRTCLNVGAIWMSMYFDRIGHARFANDGFEKTPVAPMYYGTPGAVIQHEIDENSFFTGAIIATGVGLGENPLNFDNTNGYAVVGEYGRRFADGKGTWRIMPFFCSMETPNAVGRDEQHDSVGLMTGVEYDINDRVKVYGRVSCASSEHQRARKELMVGTTMRFVPSRPQDYFGAAFGVYKGADTFESPLVNEFEKVLEFTYRVQLNDYVSIAPFYQLYIDPAYRSVSTVSATGIQAHLLF